MHAVKSNSFDYMFCQAGCVVTQTIPDMGLPVYMEWENNTFTNIFGKEAAILDARINYP